MTECKHGLATRYCALCSKTIVIIQKPPAYPNCCSPGCPRASAKQVAGLPLCLDHWKRLETQIARSYTQDHSPPQEPGFESWVYFVRIDDVIKIGYSSTPRTRIRNFASYGHQVEILSLEYDKQGGLEGRLHRKFARHRSSVGFSQELFHPVQELLDYIETGRHCTFCNRKCPPRKLACTTHQARSVELAEFEELIGVQLNTSNSTVVAIA